MDKHLLVYLFHVLVEIPLIVLGYYSLNKPKAIPKVLYKALIAVGGGLMIYHLYEAITYYRLMNTLKNHKNYP